MIRSSSAHQQEATEAQQISSEPTEGSASTARDRRIRPQRSTLINLRACQRLPTASAALRSQFLWASTRRLTELPCCSSNTQLLITHRTPPGVIKSLGYKGLIAATRMRFDTLSGSCVPQEENVYS
ncbi:hypothetical protein Q8A67_017784 [Cirrhinus molitorella]|uniref:Uncharacterized protein n=1 Tax=Cirrhinus molitorella TaxID=172907 RepID=A0AA88PIZ1_9TELE|nr:hypothetical protein Q8A67_017784 [Cirrhinus molitorella]